MKKIWFEKDQEKVFTFVGDFADTEPDERSRDWSVTAWGTEHPLEVKHVDGIQTSHYPVLDDGLRSEPELIPYQQTCWDSNFEAHDKNGAAFTCESYITPWCSAFSGGSYDTDDFNSSAMCCVCGGGCNCDPDDPTCDCAHPCPDGGCDKMDIVTPIETRYSAHSNVMTKNDAE